MTGTTVTQDNDGMKSFTFHLEEAKHGSNMKQMGPTSSPISTHAKPTFTPSETTFPVVCVTIVYQSLIAIKLIASEQTKEKDR